MQVPWYEIERHQEMTDKEVITQHTRLLKILNMDDMLGPELLFGCSRAHGLLYLHRYGRVYTESLAENHPLSKVDVGEDICTVASDAKIQHIGDMWLIYTSNGYYKIISEAVLDAVKLLQDRPRSIISAATAVTGKEILDDEEKLKLFCTIVVELIDLGKLGMLNYPNCNVSS